MPLKAEEVKVLLTKARELIGTPYSVLDCSNFVWEAYKNAGLEYKYYNTVNFNKLSGPEGKFELVPGNIPVAGDVILFTGHMGIWDPEGCAVLVDNRQCLKFGEKNAPVLSSIWGNDKNHGPDFGKMSWFSSTYTVYRWKGNK